MRISRNAQIHSVCKKANFISVTEGNIQGCTYGWGRLERPSQATLIRKSNKLGGKISILNEKFDFPP